MECPTCKADLPEDSKFCNQCGVGLFLPCPACGHGNGTPSKFCSECGAALARIAPVGRAADRSISSPPSCSSAERRQLSVMFCDLVGSVALAERLDPEELRELLGGYQRGATEIVETGGGLVARYQGDGILAYFGYPVASEDDAERAIRTAIALIEHIKRLGPTSENLQLRIGIATGTVIVGELVASAAADQPPIVGEAPNLAARLQGIAEPNTIVIAPSTHRLAGSLFEYRPLGARDLKGFSQPIDAWQVLHESVVGNRFEALRSAQAPLIGREEEIELLLRRWARAKSGEGRVVLFSGEPGIGKSRITSELIEKLPDQSHIRLHYFCSPHHRDSALYPFVGQLQRAAGFDSFDGLHAKLSKLEDLVAQSGMPIEEVTPLFADLMALPIGNRYPPLTPDTQRRRELTLKALIGCIEGLAARRTVLAIVEDVHWIDPSSRELLEMIVERVPRLPMLLLITFRPEFQPPWVGQAHVTMLTLGRLNNRDTAMLIRRTAGGEPLPDPIVNAIAKRADGIPLFIEELTKTFLESQALCEKGDNAAPRSPLAIPASLQASLMARLDRLAAGKEIAQIGAVLGREFSYELLAAVAARTDDQLRYSLSELVRAELVFKRGLPPKESYFFKHALVQDAAYHTLLRGRRKELHARVAKVIEGQFAETAEAHPEILAHHFAEAGLPDSAIDYWLKAGQRAVRRSANAEAVKHLTQGIELSALQPDALGRSRRDLALHLALGPAIRASKGAGAPETLAVFSRARELLSLSSTLPEQMAVLLGLFNAHYNRAELVAARDIAEHCLAIATEHRDAEALALANRIMGQALLTMGAFVEARRYLQHSIEIYGSAQQLGTFSGLLYGYSDRAATEAFLANTLWPLGYPEMALRTAAQALTRARASGHATMTAIALLGQAALGNLGGDPQGTAPYPDEMAAHCAQSGLTNYEHWARFNQGAQLVRRGEPHRGIEIMHDAIAAADAISARVFRPIHLGQLAVAHALIAERDVGLRLLDEAIQTAGSTGERSFEAELHRLRGELLLVAGNMGDGEVALERALNLAREQQARFWELRAAISLARHWRDQGRHAEVGNLLTPVYETFTEGSDLADLKEARSLLDDLPLVG